MAKKIRIYWYLGLALSIYYYARAELWIRRLWNGGLLPFEHQT